MSSSFRTANESRVSRNTPKNSRPPSLRRNQSNRNLVRGNSNRNLFSSFRRPRGDSSFKSRSQGLKNSRRVNPLKKSLFDYGSGSRIFDGSQLDTEEGRAQTDRGKPRPASIDLLYIPRAAIEETEKVRTIFTHFDSIEGKKRFLEKSRKKHPNPSFKALTFRLRHNRRTRKQYLTFYNQKHRRVIYEAVKEIKDWKQKASKQPRVKVIRRFVDPGGTPSDSQNRPKLDPAFTTVKQKRKPKVLTEAERSKMIRNLFYSWVNVTNEFPLESREGASLTFVKDRLYLIGGVNQKVIPEIYYLCLETLDWELVDIKDRTLGIPRFNHSAVAYGGQIVLFGGEMSNSTNHFYSRCCLNDIKILDLGKQSQPHLSFSWTKSLKFEKINFFICFGIFVDF